MDIDIVRWADRRPQPWKNGGGITFELAAGPRGAGMSDFDWRISVAEVESDGPFSVFEDIDRTLVLIEGPGVELAVDGRVAVLSKPNMKLSFSGSAATVARLIDGPIRDLNVMTRASRATHRVTAQGTGKLVPFSPRWLLFSLTESEVVLPGQTIRLERFDLIAVHGEPNGATAAGQFWLIELSPVDKASEAVLDKYV